MWKQRFLIYLYIFHTAGKGMSCLRCFLYSRHSSLRSPGPSDLGRWQLQRQRLFNMKYGYETLDQPVGRGLGARDEGEKSGLKGERAKSDKRIHQFKMLPVASFGKIVFWLFSWLNQTLHVQINFRKILSGIGGNTTPPSPSQIKMDSSAHLPYLGNDLNRTMCVSRCRIICHLEVPKSRVPASY